MWLNFAYQANVSLLDDKFVFIHILSCPPEIKHTYTRQTGGLWPFNRIILTRVRGVKF